MENTKNDIENILSWFSEAFSSPSFGQAILAYGLGISDFSKPGYYSLAEIYRRKQKHIDAHDIVESLQRYPQLPATFDGGLPSRVKGHTYDRIMIGETYFFEGIGEKGQGIIGTVTSAAVNENEKIAYIGTSTGQILKKLMSDDELEDYRSHPEAFWGRVESSPRKKPQNIYELFEWILAAYQETPKEKLLEFMRGAPDFSALQKKNQTELAIEYAERCCASIEREKGHDQLMP